MIRFDNTARVKAAAKYINLVTPMGKQSYVFDIGDEVKTTACAVVNGQGKVVDRYTQNGYCYYVVSFLPTKALREKDLEKK